jgi:hypothetical protein
MENRPPQPSKNSPYHTSFTDPCSFLFVAPQYAAMIDRLKELTAIGGITVLEIWNGADFNTVAPV